MDPPRTRARLEAPQRVNQRFRGQHLPKTYTPELSRSSKQGRTIRVSCLGFSEDIR
jgi:hypothetical protein